MVARSKKSVSTVLLPKPAGLQKDLATIWDEMAPQVRPHIGSAGLEALCIQVSRMRDAQRRITEEGIVTADNRGCPVPHPAIAIEKSASAEVRAWLLKFGERGRSTPGGKG